MKEISKEQIETILQVMYATNIPVAQFDALRKLLAELPDVKVEEPKKK